MKLMTALFPSRCRVCNSGIAKGETIWYDATGTKGKKALHQKCRDSIPAARAPTQPSLPEYHNNHVERHFESASEYIALKPSEVNREFWDNYTGNRYKYLSTDWLGINGGYAALICAINGGWSDGLRKVEENLRDVTAPPMAGLRRRVVRGDFGDEVDIHRINSGDTERAWTSRRRRMSAHGHAQKTLLIKLNASHSVTAEQMFWRGAAAIKLCDAITDAGYGVEIIALNCADKLNGRSGLLDSFAIKSFDMPLDRLELATITCLAGFFRIFGFKAYTSMDYTINRSFGEPSDKYPTRFQSADAIKGLENIDSRETAQAFINKTIAALSHEDDALAA